jgi:uncharacterized protein (TIGR03663 family)
MSKKKKKTVESGEWRVESEKTGLENLDAGIEDLEERTQGTFWYVSCGLITAIAVFLRFFWLELKPLHHDEGVNGFFLIRLFREGAYQYDPANYHGPDLYYIALAFSKIFGLNTISIRSSVAIFGVLTVVLAFFLRRYIGRIGSLSAALFLALSPGMVFISRYFIHEILFVFFSLSLVVSMAYFIEKRKAGIFSIIWMILLLMVCFLSPALSLAIYYGGENMTLVWTLRIVIFAVESVLIFFVMRLLLAWNEGRPIYFLLASASLVLLFATKETAFITIGTMIIACVCVWFWRRMHQKSFGEVGTDTLSEKPLTWENFLEALGNSDFFIITIVFAAVFVYVGILFFSSFFSYPEGVKKAFEAYAIWTKTGSKDHTQSGRLAYVNWLWEIEAPLIILSVVGTAIAFIKARHRFALFTALWAFGLFIAYSIIPYKTPWLMLSFMLPMCIIGGYAINELAISKAPIQKIIAAILAVASAGILSYQTYELNFVKYDDDSMPYVYAHTRRGFLDLVKEINRYAEKSGKGKDATIEIVSPDYWSMPWYMKDYKAAIFQGHLVDANTAEMIVASKAQLPELAPRYAAHYKYVGTYPLRPGVDLYLLVRKDLADTTAKEIYQIPPE